MKISNSLVLFDSNILIHAQNIDSPFYKKAIDLHRQVFEAEIAAAVTTQNLLEFYSSITNTKRLANPLASTQAAIEIQNYLTRSGFKIIKPKGDELNLLPKLIKEKEIKGLPIFDAYLVATMLSNGIDIVYTQNEKDFKIFKEIKVVNPFK